MQQQQEEEEEEDAGSSRRMLDFRLFLFRFFFKVTLREAEVQSTCYMPYYCSTMKAI
jgi:hypothetical protein